MKHLASLNHFFWKYKTRLVLGLLFVVFTNYFRILAPQLTGYVVNTVVQVVDGKTLEPTVGKLKQYDLVVNIIVQQLQQQSLKAKVFWCGIILLILALISGFFMFLMRQTIIVMSRLIEYDQKNQVFKSQPEVECGF